MLCGKSHRLVHFLLDDRRRAVGFRALEGHSVSWAAMGDAVRGRPPRGNGMLHL